VKKERTILKKLYTLADPLIQRLPGRTVDEKRTIFNTIVITSILVLYASPLPWLAVTYVHTPLGLLGTLTLIVVIPVLAVFYLLDVYDEYREKIKEIKKKRRSG